MGSGVALVVVDVQLGMLESPVIPPIRDGGRLLERIVGLVRDAREAGVPVVFVQHDGEPVIQKRTPDSFLNTTLSEELASRNIGGLVLAGMQTEYCVDTTCRRAFGLGYDVTLAKDAHGTWDKDALSAQQIVAHHNEVLGGGFATAMNAGEIRFEEMATE